MRKHDCVFSISVSWGCVSSCYAKLPLFICQWYMVNKTRSVDAHLQFSAAQRALNTDADNATTFSCIDLKCILGCREAVQTAAAGCLFILGRERSSSWHRKRLSHLATLLYQQFSISSMKYPTNSGLINGLCWLSAFMHWCKCFPVARAWTEN